MAEANNKICRLCGCQAHGSKPCTGTNCFCGHDGHWTKEILEREDPKEA